MKEIGKAIVCVVLIIAICCANLPQDTLNLFIFLAGVIILNLIWDD